ncbi:MAG: Type 1 glutamine amidotransferase-like domain-containing protein [Clostridia bacterium]|nr:Type 1 glutamine amidotransferase-like domain-containing protein [Clostridia bacterium]
MKTLVAIGGGDMRLKTTLKIDEYIANLAKERAGDRRAVGLYIGTASHDFMPAFNTFRKTYTSVFNIKADCLLLEKVETTSEKIDEKLSKADFIYVSGGDTLYMLKKWQERGLTQKIISAYDNGVILAGRSAGAVCWFENMYTDSEILSGASNEYKFYKGLGLINGSMCPHYNLREKDLKSAMVTMSVNSVYAVCDDCALVFKNGVFEKTVSSGNNAYLLTQENGIITEKSL